MQMAYLVGRPIGTLSETISELVELRLQLGMSQKKLASILGMSEWAVNRYELNKIKAPFCYLLALRWLVAMRDGGCPRCIDLELSKRTKK